MKVLGFDTETTGVDPKTAQVLEIGAVVFDVEGGVWTPDEGFSALVSPSDIIGEIPKEASDVNGITMDMLAKEGMPFESIMARLTDLCLSHEVTYRIAHNMEYDDTVVNAECVRKGLRSMFNTIPTICSLTHIEAVNAKKCKKLSHLALDFGLTVNPAELHRAMDDVLLMGKLLTQLKADPETMMNFKKEPTVVLATQVVKPWEDNGFDKGKASEQGYRWENAAGKNYPKRWVKAVKKNKLDLETRPYIIVEEL